MVPTTGPSIIGRRQQGFDLWPGEETDQALDLSLERDGQNAACASRQFRPQPIDQYAMGEWQDVGFDQLFLSTLCASDRENEYRFGRD